MSGSRVLRRIARSFELPSFPTVVARLQTLLEAPEPSVEEAAELIMEDPGIASRIMKIASSPLYNPMGIEFDNMEQALVRIGLGEVRDMVATVAVVNAFSDCADKEVTRRVWQHSVTSGIAAGLLSSHCAGCETVPSRSNPYFLAGLMHDVGVFLLSAVLGEKRQKILEQSIATGQPVLEIEERELGFGHAEAGAELLASWGLPEAIVGVARYHHDPTRAPEQFRQPAMIVHVADWISDHQGYGWGEFGGTLCDAAWTELGISWEDIDVLIEEFDAAARDAAHILSALDSKG